MKALHRFAAGAIWLSAVAATGWSGADAGRENGGGTAQAGQRQLAVDSTVQQQWRPPGGPPRFVPPPRIPGPPALPPGWGQPPTMPTPPPPFTPQPSTPESQPSVPSSSTPTPSTPQPQLPRYSPIPDILVPTPGQNPAVGSPAMPPGGPPVKQIWICSHCRRQLPDDVRPGDRCPYCGTFLAYQRDASGKITNTIPIGKYLLVGGLIPVGAIVIGLVVWFLKNL